MEKINCSKRTLKSLLQQVRNNVFPREIEVALSEFFCKTMDNPSQCFLVARNSIGITDPKTNITTIQNYVILASKFMLSLLENTKWYIDATFSIAPPTFSQVLIILIIDEKAKEIFPGA